MYSNSLLSFSLLSLPSPTASPLLVPPPSSSHSRRSHETGVHEEAELEVPRAVFDYVDEDEYARIVQERQEEGFVLDDGGWSQGHNATDIISSSTYQVVYQ